jgi:hypothetical protein
MDAEALDERRTLTVRLTVPQWKRVKSFAVELDVSIQMLLVAGLNRLLAENGQALLDPESPILPPTKKRKPRPRGEAT